MNRANLQELARTRIREAQVLLASSEYSGAYYLAGYSVECALKSCFAKSVRRYDFPDRKGAGKVFIHHLGDLAKLAKLDEEMLQAEEEPNFARNWRLVRGWTEESRYSLWSEAEAVDMLDAIMNKKYGVLPWIQRRW